jgi:bifunctional DNase/RNase
MIRVTIDGIFLTQTHASGILLKDKEGGRTLPIIIGEYEAQSIALGLENKKPPRPITHDLILNLLDAANLSLEKVVISELRDNTYYALLHMESAYGKMEVDSRPSDAIAIAVRLDVPIFVEEEVMEQAAYNYSDKDRDELEKALFGKSVDEDLEKLKKDLQKAVEAEEYEKAAQIRDRIKQLEAKS